MKLYLLFLFVMMACNSRLPLKKKCACSYVPKGNAWIYQKESGLMIVFKDNKPDCYYYAKQVQIR